MHRQVLGRDAESLVARERELSQIDALLSSARSGSGSVLLIEGPAGIGTTSLLAVARGWASDGGMRVLHGRASELERDYPLGVIRQCLEPAIRREPDRERLLRGAARLAGRLLLDAPQTVEATSIGLLHGLYWLVANLADEAPLLLVVDDAHWSDEPSLRFLAYLARRVNSLPIALVIAARHDQDQESVAGSVLVEIMADPAGARVEPSALALADVERLLRELEGGPVDKAFARACHDATGGNPFLIGALVQALRADGVPFSAAGAGRVTDISPPSVARAVAADLARLGSPATALARAAVTLGDGVAVELAAQLAEVSVEQAAAAMAGLVRSGLLDDATVLRFRHPLIASAVRAGLPAHERAAAHARAAGLLRARGAAPERVALQLLHAPAAGDPAVVSDLRLAAEHARERGAPASAVVLLQRALLEPPDTALRGELLFELGHAELAMGNAGDAGDHLAEAPRCAVDPLIRGRALALLAQAVPDQARVREIVELIDAALPDLERRDRELALRLRAVQVLEGRRPDLETPLPGATLCEAIFMGHLVFARMRPQATAAEIADIATRAARQADGLLGEGASAIALTGVVLGLRWTDRLDDAERLMDRAVASARRRGSTTDFAAAMTLRALIYRRAGRLRDAEADARVALAAVLDLEWSFA
ncbi:MAG TPA: AAA family ATPase, partial [Solirubrobacteraceae bacterium]|nr:AAA family ATPase [Solirubrobacteraceae bacterium]